MKRQILGVLLPFISFMHTFDRKRGHNMLALMFNPQLTIFFQVIKMLLLMLLNMIKSFVVFTNKNKQIVDVATLTSSS